MSRAIVFLDSVIAMSGQVKSGKIVQDHVNRPRTRGIMHLVPSVRMFVVVCKMRVLTLWGLISTLL